jgi:hypothetical protein
VKKEGTNILRFVSQQQPGRFVDAFCQQRRRVAADFVGALDVGAITTP